VQQEVVLAMLAKEPSYGYQLRAMNAGQVYVTLPRLERLAC
jgi:DNA-binding PadR family transcriptional regulator